MNRDFSAHHLYPTTTIIPLPPPQKKLINLKRHWEWEIEAGLLQELFLPWGNALEHSLSSLAIELL